MAAVQFYGQLHIVIFGGVVGGGGGGGGGEVRPCNSNIAYPRFINFFCAFL